MFFRRYARTSCSCGALPFYRPVTNQHYTPEAALGAAWDEAFSRYPFNDTARKLFISTTVGVREPTPDPKMGPPIPLHDQSREADYTTTLPELCNGYPPFVERRA